LSVDKINSVDNPVLGEQQVEYDTTNTGLLLFLNNTSSTYINVVGKSQALYNADKSYLTSASSLMQDKYYNSPISIDKLGDNDLYTSAISENLSLANQSR
jgi:hypothetical protein